MFRTALPFAVIFLAFAGPVSAQTFLGKTVQVWLTELETGTDTARRGAAFALGKAGGANVVPALKKHLHDKDSRVRDEAAFALGEIARRSLNGAGDPALVTALAETLDKDDQPLVRRSAAFALGCIGSDAQAALPALTRALKDKTPVVRQNAAFALAKLGKPAIPALREALHDADPLVKRDAARSMGPLEPDAIRPAVTDLANLCRDNNSEVRRAALSTLIKNVTPDDVREAGMIQAALNDADEEVRNFAALTLANIGGKPAQVAVPQLLAAIKQQGLVELRREAAAGISKIGPFAKAAVPELITLLHDPDDKVRSNAALALSGIGPEAVAAYGPLMDVLENTKEQPDIRVGAAFALSRIGKVPAAAAAVPRLLKILGNPAENVNVRGRVMWALRVHNEDLRKMDIYPTLYKILAEPKNADNRMLRYDSAYMLGMLQGSSVEAPAMETLHEFLQDDTIQIFVKVDVNVGAVGNEVGGSTGRRAETGKGDGRVMATQALQSIGPRRVGEHKGIVAELRKLSTNNGTYGELKDMCADILKKISAK